MLIVTFGTTAEVIKLAPVLHRLDRQGLAYLTVSTNQQAAQLPSFQRDLGLQPSDVNLAYGYRGQDLDRAANIPIWLATITRSFMTQRRGLRRQIYDQPGNHMLMVHGDTMTTALGAGMGRMLGLPVAHLEAGMRSGDWRNPFPEELNRRFVGRFATIHYAATQREVNNLSRNCGDVILIGANTVLDAVNLVPDGFGAAAEVLGPLAPDGHFGLVSLHRSELLSRRQRIVEILDEVMRAQLEYPVFFIDHPVTIYALRAHGLDQSIGNLIRIPRMGYMPFIQLLRRSEFLVTDSGGCQEECFYLDVPCLVHRLVTERGEGLGTNAVISKYDLNVVRQFLHHPDRWRTGRRPPLTSPSDVVVEDLIRRGVWAGA